jgi:phage gpG-like protein
MNDGVRPGKGPSSILRISTGIVTIGSSLAYAAMMNWGTTGLPGGVLKPKNAKALRFKIGRNVVFCKSVKIPERRFDTFTKADQAELQATLVNTIEELFRG